MTKKPVDPNLAISNATGNIRDGLESARQREHLPKDAPVALVSLTSESLSKRVLEEIGQLQDGWGEAAPAMTPDDWEAMKVSVALSALQLDKVTLRIENSIEALTL